MAKHCFVPAKILLPEEKIPMKQWACIACDQFTSQPEYWQQAEQVVGDTPSTLRLILPEAYLGSQQEEKRIQKIHSTMEEYLKTVLARSVEGFIYLERTTESGVRQGLVGMVDLEEYSCLPGAKPLIRPSEETVLDRVPPRMTVRRGASLETSHVMMLVDDQEKTLVEPIAAQKEQLRPVYGGELMQGSGSVQGWAVEDPALVQQIVAAVDALGSQETFDRSWPDEAGQPPLAMMVGDGNHSLAAAKGCWEEIKAGLTPEEREHHPARYCLAEICNLHSPAIQVEPIHRVMFGANAASVLLCLSEFVDYRRGKIMAGTAAEQCRQKLDLVLPCRQVRVGFDHTWQPLTVGTVEEFIQDYCADHPGVRVDYIHGQDTAYRLAKQDGVGFLLPPLEKKELFRGVVMGGVLPRKTFSMGHAEEKRCYIECRKIRE